MWKNWFDVWFLYCWKLDTLEVKTLIKSIHSEYNKIHLVFLPIEHFLFIYTNTHKAKVLLPISYHLAPLHFSRSWGGQARQRDWELISSKCISDLLGAALPGPACAAAGWDERPGPRGWRGRPCLRPGGCRGCTASPCPEPSACQLPSAAARGGSRNHGWSVKRVAREDRLKGRRDHWQTTKVLCVLGKRHRNLSKVRPHWIYKLSHKMQLIGVQSEFVVGSIPCWNVSTFSLSWAIVMLGETTTFTGT